MERSTVGSLLRSSQAHCQQLCEKESLTHGIAFYSRRFADLAETNQFREVYLDDSAALPVAYDQVERWFGERGLRCRCWAPAMGQSPEALAPFLIERGYRTRVFVAYALARWVEGKATAGGRIVPARAVRAAFQETFAHDSALGLDIEREAGARAGNERLDDPQFDTFVALLDGRPAGRCTLYQVGDFARVMDLCVLPAHHNRGVERTLLTHALTLAKRLAMRHVYTQVDAEDSRMLSLMEDVGFVRDGELIEYHRDCDRSHGGGR